MTKLWSKQKKLQRRGDFFLFLTVYVKRVYIFYYLKFFFCVVWKDLNERKKKNKNVMIKLKKPASKKRKISDIHDKLDDKEDDHSDEEKDSEVDDF